MKIKGHLQGPIEKFKKALSKQAAVMEVDEFATSALCPQCGYAIQHPLNGSMQGVSFCNNRNCSHFMINRDTDAAYKIAYVWMARGLGYNLGPFARGNYVKDRRPDPNVDVDLFAVPRGQHSIRELYECQIYSPQGDSIGHRCICKLPLLA